MKKIVYSIISIIMVALLSLSNSIVALASTETNNLSSEEIAEMMNYDFADDRVIVIINQKDSLKFNDYSPKTFFEIDCSEVYKLSAAVENKIKAAISSILSAISEQKIPDINEEWDFSGFNSIISIKLNTPGKENVIRAINALRARDDVMYAGPDYLISMNYDLEEMSETSSVNYTPIETINNLLELPKAWDAAEYTFEKSLRIAVIDSGIDKSHELLNLLAQSTHMWADYSDYYTNPDDIPTDHSDATGHGTHVAGIIASVIDDNFWDPDNINKYIDLISVKVFDSNGEAYMSEVVAAINYVESENVKLINFSGGGDIPAYGTDVATSLYEAIEQYQGLFICAAGNDGVNINNSNFFPAALSLDNIITVGSSTVADQIASSSNYGNVAVDLFAPGVSIYSCFPNEKCGDNCTNSSTHVSNGYHSLSGTSMATPFVTGVAAMLMAIDGDLSYSTIKNVIMNSVDPCDNLESKCVSGGRLNAYNAVLTVMGNCSHTSVRYSNNGSTHTMYCNSCSYQKTESHSLYIKAIYDSDNGCDVACLYCSYTFHCDCNPEYGANDTTGHEVSCPDGYFSFFEEHTFLPSYLPVDIYHHTLKCTVCNYTFEVSHTWVTDGDYVVCSVCGYSAEYGPGIMSLSDAELEAYLATLSDEELAELTLTLNEADHVRITALLPEKEDEFVIE